MKVYLLEAHDRRGRLRRLLDYHKSSRQAADALKSQADVLDRRAQRHFSTMADRDQPDFERAQAQAKFVQSSRTSQDRDKQSSRLGMRSTRAKAIVKKFLARPGTQARAKNHFLSKFFGGFGKKFGAAASSAAHNKLKAIQGGQ